MKEELIFCPLGGSGEIGMNMNLFAYGNPDNRKWIIVDIGVTFADDAIPGVDLIYPDPGFIVDKKDDLLGIVLTHAHEDHIGAIAHIWPKLKCKIFATPFTSVLISEKFKEKKIDVTGYLEVVQLNSIVDLSPFKIEFVTLTHSILEPNGLKIETPVGNILHTGDWKCDPDPLTGDNMNSKRLKEIGEEGVLTMICDSTNVFSAGRAGSELDVRKNMLKIMERLKKRHPDVFVERGDAVIFSSKIIPGNEKKLYKLHNQLVREGIEVISEDSEFIHVSGHPNREDLKDMYDWIKPRSVIPVHGEHRHMIEHINFAKEMQVPYPVRVENGDIVRIYPGDKPEVYDKAPSGRLYVDGSISVEEDAQSIKERKNLSTNGLIEATLVITPNGNIHNKPLLTFRGLPIYEKDEFTFNLEEEIEKTAKTFSLNNKKQESNLIDALKITCRKYTKEKLGKRPYTNINLVRI